MRRICVAGGLMGILALASSAAAQTPAVPPPAPAAGGTRGQISIGGVVGVEGVQNVGALVGGELNYQLSDDLELTGEFAWIQDASTRAQADRMQTLSSYLQTTQGQTASGTIKAPASYGGGGVRVMLTHGGTIRPYFVVTAGAAHVALKPTVTVAGADVTTNLAPYGVTLGSDLSGEETVAAFTGGVGVRYGQPQWYLDGTIGVTNMRTTGQATNVLRASIGVGLKF